MADINRSLRLVEKYIDDDVAEDIRKYIGTFQLDAERYRKLKAHRTDAGFHEWQLSYSDNTFDAAVDVLEVK